MRYNGSLCAYIAMIVLIVNVSDDLAVLDIEDEVGVVREEGQVA